MSSTSAPALGARRCPRLTKLSQSLSDPISTTGSRLTAVHLHGPPPSPEDACVPCHGALIHHTQQLPVHSSLPSGLCSDGTPAPRQAFPDHFHTAPSLHSLPLFLYFLHIASSPPYFLFYYLMFYYPSPALEQKLHQSKDSSLIWFCCCFSNTKNSAWHTADAHYLSHYERTVIKSRDV